MQNKTEEIGCLTNELSDLILNPVKVIQLKDNSLKGDTETWNRNIDQFFNTLKKIKYNIQEIGLGLSAEDILNEL